MNSARVSLPAKESLGCPTAQPLFTLSSINLKELFFTLLWIRGTPRNFPSSCVPWKPTSSHICLLDCQGTFLEK